MTRFVPVILFVTVLCDPASAARFTYEPISDLDDGQLIDGSTWDYRPGESTVSDLLLSLGQQGKNTYDVSLAFTLADFAEGSVVSDVRLRLGEQGGEIGTGLGIEISAALDLDPLAATGLSRFLLPRTAKRVHWQISADWDSSGQHIAKWEETPDLSPILNELLAQPGWDGSAKAAVFFLELDSAIGNNIVRFDDTHGAYSPGGNPGIRPAQLIVSELFYDAFWGKELLCRPRPTSIEVNIIPHKNTDAYVEWGGASLTYGNVSPTVLVAGGSAANLTMDDLAPGTQYWYRLRHRPAGGGAFVEGPARTFVTLPTGNADARLAITSDMHVTNSAALGLDTHLALLNTTLQYMEGFLNPDRFHVWMDLGDLVVVRAQRIAFDLEEVEQRYRQAREYIDGVGHSLPFVFVRGNHEEVNGWDYDGSPDNTAIWSGSMLLKYFPPPLPDAFYSGNTVPYSDFPAPGLPGNYFAFDVGPMRVRALDPYLFSDTRPHNGHGETGGSLNGWDWTIGDQQYLWLHDDMQQNQSLYSLLTLHHLSSCYVGGGEYYGRGGTEIAKYSVDGRPSFEWGGEDSTGTDVLAAQRPGFTYGSVHDMLVAGGNQVLVKGHDHFHARQELDGMTYLTLAKPDDTGQQTGNLWGWRFFSFYPDPITVEAENSGFINVSVTATETSYEYIQTYPASGMGTVLDAFSVSPGDATGAGEPSLPAARRTAIRGAIPNPVQSYSRIEYELARKGQVRLAVYDTGGRLVRELVNEYRPEGVHSTLWDGRDRNNRRVASGVYFARLHSEGRRDAVKMILVR